ncbi:hypothetical protein ASPZODRAFT_134732 [Penicilliopsis zonata CBS 506.65]|uniref:Amino acid permease/ SLC12A domain-containing protein n=1 Tax=Penicilliopsis zonata CBS 506.65 TaxID=1073090 RepID=A0A1L9SBY1_9EURO|nr:hypothetical protein ASPZODRAFT_134732 [Penicilliopsis zonata CBS 506.65]OJJ44652.1 hypothetical protein ASPZODRAFT_134732 [Penicilliopsis zonata CBS 506.65]
MMDERGIGTSSPVPRKRPNFSARTAAEDVARLAPSESPDASPERKHRSLRQGSAASDQPYEPAASASQTSYRHDPLPLPSSFWGRVSRWLHNRGERDSQGRCQGDMQPHSSLDTALARESNYGKRDRNRHKHQSVDDSGKLGTFSGVFVPTTLNVLSILMFLRFGFILGQGGVLGMMGLLIVSYAINLVTTMSLSAIATNGTVRGGGAYYLISRSLGPEFGGSIGMVFYLGYVFNTGMNAVGLVDCFTQNFGTETGTWANFLEEGFWWQYLWSTIILIICTGICLAGSSIFARASNGLLVILLIATFSIPFSALFMRPFSIPRLGVEFTGVRLQTFMQNLKPKLTKGAAGSQVHGRENFQDLFGILFPATGGIFAGASMSGDLKNPSKSIPKGTLSGLALTFVTYTLVIFAMAASITRESFYNNLNVIQVANLSGTIVLLGEFASTFFSALMGVIGSAKLLQAIARDNLLPGLEIFGRGTRKSDEPVNAIIITFVVAQLTMLFDINRIASFVTMTYLMTFLVTNLACFLLKIGSAPNFRPSFHYFNWQTAAAGTLISGLSMFFVDGLYATGCVGILVMIFLLIHYTSPPKSWGDVSQSLIYHQVRKYLLRLRQEHVKFWRPQILLFVNDFETQYKMVSFCNSLKKGALFVLGHVIVTDDFSGAVPEARRKQISWTKIIEYSKIKAFVNLAVSPSVEWGVRNIVLNSGLGGMRPNIVVIDQYRKAQNIAGTWQGGFHGRDSRSRRLSSQWSAGFEDSQETGPSHSEMNCKSYVTILEDLLFKLRINVAVAKGFEDLVLPGSENQHTKKYIDLWPIQMSAEFGDDNASKQSVLTTNFDTYTLILQLGCILHTVPSWRKVYTLRVAVFVEYETDVDDERGRVEALLEKLRIEAEVVVFWLACGELKAYKIIVNGDTTGMDADALAMVDTALKGESWWQDTKKFRENTHRDSQSEDRGRAAKLRAAMLDWQGSTSEGSVMRLNSPRIGGLRKLLRSPKRRRSVSSYRTLGGVNLGMQTHRLLDALVDYDATDRTSSSSSSDSEFDPYISENDYEDDDDDDEENYGNDYHNGGSGRPGQQGQGNLSLSNERLNSTTTTIPAIVTPDEGTSPKTNLTADRPSIARSPSSNRFSSAPIPEARVNLEEESGPSIMFAPSPSSSPPSRHHSIYQHRSHSGGLGSGAKPPASGYPGHAALPLSFNDLPSRAQHLILNELMVKHSSETAVAFTTLPPPLQGTSQSEELSESYLSDLEVLWQGLPPCLLVHSNSMTVTMNL